MKRTKKNHQADCLQTGKSERTAARAAKCVTVRRFINSRNIVGILSSHKQTMLSNLTSILFFIIG